MGSTNVIEGGSHMSTTLDSPAVAVARSHVEAWTNHEFDTARKVLADDVHVTALTTQPGRPATDLTGVEDYMTGLIQFAGAIVPGSATILASVGDEHNALLMLTVEADFGAGRVMLPAARLYRLDGDGKIDKELVVFYAAAS
jgi:hypothetical protein